MVMSLLLVSQVVIFKSLIYENDVYIPYPPSFVHALPVGNC